MRSRLTRERWLQLRAMRSDVFEFASDVADLADTVCEWNGYKRVSSASLRHIAQDMEAALRVWLEAEPVGGRLATEDERKRYGATHVRYFRDPQFADDEGVNRGEG